jgi:HAD superfamily hydrolase (TIGR01509 family)
VGIRKPDPAIYHLVLERLDLRVDDAHRAVFLDDFEHNVRAARSVGMHGIVVGVDPRPALDELDAILGAATRP